MKSFSIVCFSWISFAFAASSLLHIENGIRQNYECFRNYTQQLVGVNRDFEDALRACYDKNNIKRRPPPEQLDPQAVIENYKQTLEETCVNLTACNNLRDSFELFNCLLRTAEESVKEFFALRSNASSVALELNDQLDQETKEVLRCQLFAEREYIAKSSIVYNKHANCLHSFK